MTIYHFEVVPFRAIKTVKCSGCRKILRRAKTFDQTINPYNRLLNGQVKNRKDILAELRLEAAVWMREEEICLPCLNKAKP